MQGEAGSSIPIFSLSESLNTSIYSTSTHLFSFNHLDLSASSNCLSQSVGFSSP